MTPAHTKRRWLRTWVVVAIASAVVVLGAAGGAYALLHSRFFAASIVKVTGERHESAAQVTNVAGLTASPPMISVDPSTIRQRVEAAFPWVATATVTQSWPHTVTIALTERTPVAVVPGPKGTSVLVDVSGRRLGPPGQGQLLPRLQYAVAPGQPASPGALSAAAEPGLIVASTLPPAFSAQVAVVQVDDRGWVTLHLTTPVTFVLGPASNLGAKYEDVAAVIGRTTLHVGDVVDVSVPQAMTVTGP